MSARASSEPPNDDEVDALRRTSDRIERLLGELRASTAPAAWARIEELVSLLTTIYGQGLARTLEAFAERGGIDERTRARLCDDPLVASLLLLHGLHPASLEERIARAIDRVRSAIGQAAGEIAVSPIDEAGALEVRLSGDWRRSPVPAAGIQAALRRAIEEAAPDLTHLAIESEGSFSASSSGLVQIDLARSRQGTSTEAR